MEAYLISAVGGLAAAIGVLYGTIAKDKKRTESRLTDCEEDRADLWNVILHAAKCQIKHDPGGMQKVVEVASQRVDGKRNRPGSG